MPTTAHRHAAHAYPRMVTFVDALPKIPSGKVRRETVRAASGSVDDHRGARCEGAPVR